MNVFTTNLQLILALTLCNSAFKLPRKYFLDESFIAYEIAIKTTGDFENTLQFETSHQNGLECGGVYLKYLRPEEAGWKSKGFDESPLSIVFGPNKCCSTNEVHFIFKHKNPKSGEYVEHHLKFSPFVPSHNLLYMYTAILKPDNEVLILFDREQKNKVNFLSAEDFEPSLIPAKTISDPDDKKPQDWDEREMTLDLDAVKPDYWDEDVPMEIEDKKP